MFENGHQLIDPGGRKQPIRASVMEIDERRFIEQRRRHYAMLGQVVHHKC